MNIFKCHDQNLEIKNIILLKYIKDIDKSNQRADVSRETPKSFRQFETYAEKALWFCWIVRTFTRILKVLHQGRSFSEYKI